MYVCTYVEKERVIVPPARLNPHTCLNNQDKTPLATVAFCLTSIVLQLAKLDRTWMFR